MAVQLAFPNGQPWEPDAPTDPLARRVLATLRDGHTHDRAALAQQHGVGVRQLRKVVARLREGGWPVGYGADNGYRLSWEPSDLERLERKYKTQAMAQLRTLRLIRRARERLSAA